MFQNSTYGAIDVYSSRSLRHALFELNSPTGMYGRFSISAVWYSVRSFLNSAEPGAVFPRSSSAFEARGEHGQPNQARSQSVEMFE